MKLAVFSEHSGLMVRGASLGYDGQTACMVFHISGFRRTQCRCVSDVSPGISCRVYVGLHLGPVSWCVSVVEWPNLHFECTRAAVNQQQACVFSPISLPQNELFPSERVRQELEGQTAVNRHGGTQPRAPPVPGEPTVHRHTCRQNTMRVKIEKEKRRKARVYSAGQPLPLCAPEQ